jgi:hypothetical protein
MECSLLTVGDACGPEAARAVALFAPFRGNYKAVRPLAYQWLQLRAGLAD